jgi:hypothetical protein
MRVPLPRIEHFAVFTAFGPFAQLHAISTPGSPTAEGGPNSQRIFIPYCVKFPASALGAFPSPGNSTVQMLLIARFSVSVSGARNSYAAETNIELTAGADPYFQNVNPTANNPFYLSQDLCGFTVNPKQVPTIDGVPSFTAFAPTLRLIAEVAQTRSSRVDQLSSISMN